MEIICSHQAPGVLFDLVLVVELSTEMVTTHMPSEGKPGTKRDRKCGLGLGGKQMTIALGFWMRSE